jgi:hypothetical protein
MASGSEDCIVALRQCHKDQRLLGWNFDRDKAEDALWFKNTGLFIPALIVARGSLGVYGFRNRSDHSCERLGFANLQW